MYLPKIVYQQKPIICLSIGLIAKMMFERSTLLTVAQVLLLIAATAIIQRRQGGAEMKRVTLR
jgi:hypothetical protein